VGELVAMEMDDIGAEDLVLFASVLAETEVEVETEESIPIR
jgi:hypothetical protein